MIGAYATAAVIIAASVAIGQAVFVLAGRRAFTWLSAPVGLAALLTVSGITIKLPGHSTATAIALAVVIAASAVVLLTSGRGGGGIPNHGPARATTAPLLAGGIALLLASLPFITAGHVGILGVGLVNDDMSYHLLIADWIGSHVGHMPTLVRQGYPVGPHALVDGLTSILGTSLVNGFAGLTVALPALTAMVAAGALTSARAVWRVAVGALAAVAYLTAAYLAQEAFKEPIEALMLLGFALYLPSIRTVRDGLPSVVICAGVVYVYSFPGLFWLAGTTLAYWAIARPWETVKPFLAAHALVLVLIAPEAGRLVDFSHFKAFSPSTANSGGLGNLRHHLSPFEALGIWPTSEFRLAASDAGHPIAFYAGSLLALGAFALGLPRWVRRYGWALAAALASAALIYVVARISGTVYTSAKALAIASPLILLTVLGGLVSNENADPATPRGTGASGGGNEDIRSMDARTVRSTDAKRLRGLLPAIPATLGVLVGLAALASSFLVLRQAPIGPTDHATELASFRPIIGARKVLFLGRDDFIQEELRPAKPYVAVRNYYDNYYVKPNLALQNVFDKFDFDSVKVADLARFPYVITTRAAYASGPPPWLKPVRTTASFILWRRSAPPRSLDRHVLDEGASPGANRRCGLGATGFGGEATVFRRKPIVGAGWSAGPTVESGSGTSQTLRVPAGTWDVSIQYDATRPLTISATGLDGGTIPGNLDYRGTTPYYAAGMLTVKRSGPVTFSVGVERPPFFGRLLGASSVAHLGSLALTPASGSDSAAAVRPGAGEGTVPLERSCGRYVDWFRTT